MPSGAVCHFHREKRLWGGIKNSFAHKKRTHKCSAKQSSNEDLFFTVRIFQSTVPPGRGGWLIPLKRAVPGTAASRRLKLPRDAQQFKLSHISSTRAFGFFLVATCSGCPAPRVSLSLSLTPSLQSSCYLSLWQAVTEFP